MKIFEAEFKHVVESIYMRIKRRENRSYVHQYVIDTLAQQGVWPLLSKCETQN